MKELIELLESHSLNKYYGVPDSLLGGLIEDICDDKNTSVDIVANEGIAIASAIGHFIAKKKMACVFMQNSGIGNAYNPLVSLAAKEIYSIPMILMIGWRAELDSSKEQLKDEPQHRLQGKITLEQLELMGIPYEVISGTKDIKKCDKLIEKSKEENIPVALVFRKKAVGKIKRVPEHLKEYQKLPTRKEVISELRKSIKNTPIFCTTGKSSRELYEENENNGNEHDFYCVGGMGHVSTIAQEFKRNKDVSQVYCIDGDGALLMHLASMQRCSKVKGFNHILINNYCHESVGGLPTHIQTVDIVNIARSFGYSTVQSVDSIEDIKYALEKMDIDGSNFLEIKTSVEKRDDLPRPKKKPIENLNMFMERKFA